MASSTPPPTRSAVYLRVSRDDGTQTEENQLLNLQDYAAQGWETVGPYVDRASGRRGRADRAAFDRMMADALRRRFDVVLFWALDRLTREGVSTTFGYIERLPEAGVGIHSYTQPLSTAVENRLVRDIVLAVPAAVAEDEWAQISERAEAGAGGGEAARALARPANAVSAVAVALRALRCPPARSVLHRLLGATPGAELSARRALFRFGDARALHAALAGRTPSHVLDVALLGDLSHGPGLATSARAGNAGGPVALGVHGDAASVPLLLDLLSSPETTAEAALGLRVLTGAPLVEDVLVHDDPDLGGALVVRTSRSPDDWRAWWAEHSRAFRPRTRYRAGRPFALAVAVTAPVGGLSDDLLPAPLRDALAGRYGLDAPFRADAFVADQQAALRALAEAAAST